MIHAQPPALDDAGSCTDQSGCGAPLAPGDTYGNCCGDPARMSFLRSMPFDCFECPSGMLNFYIATLVSYIAIAS